MPGLAGSRDRVADRIEQRREVVGAQVRAEDPVHRADPDRHRAVFARKVLAAGVDRTGVHDDVGTGLGEQLDEPGDRRRHAVRVDAAIEAGRRLGAQVGPSDGLADADQREPGHLERDRGRGVVDLRVETPHDPADTDRTVVSVTDEEVVHRERAVLAVEGREMLTLASETDPEAAPAEGVDVVGMIRLVQLEHHVVADVDDVADRSHPGGGEPARHPLG